MVYNTVKLYNRALLIGASYCGQESGTLPAEECDMHYADLVDDIMEQALYTRKGLESTTFRQILWLPLMGIVPFKGLMGNTFSAKRIKSFLYFDENQQRLGVNGDGELASTVIQQIERDAVRTSSLFVENVKDCVTLLKEILITLFSRHLDARGLQYTQGVHECIVMLIRMFVPYTVNTDNKQSGLGPLNHREGIANITSLVTATRERPEKNLIAYWQSNVPTEHVEIMLKLQAMSERLVLGHACDFLASPLELSVVAHLKLIGVLLRLQDPALFSLLTLAAQWRHFCDYGELSETEAISCHQTHIDAKANDKTNHLFLDVVPFLTGYEFQFCLPWIVTLFTHDLLAVDVADSQQRFNLCARLWDSLLAGPPTFALYLCTALLRHCYVRRQLFALAEHYGIAERDRLSRDEQSKLSSGYQSFPSCSRHKNTSLFLGLCFHKKKCDPQQFDLLSTELVMFIQRLFKDTLFEQLKLVIEDSLLDAAALCFPPPQRTKCNFAGCTPAENVDLMRQQFDSRLDCTALIKLYLFDEELPVFSPLKCSIQQWPWRSLSAPYKLCLYETVTVQDNTDCWKTHTPLLYRFKQQVFDEQLKKAAARITQHRAAILQKPPPHRASRSRSAQVASRALSYILPCLQYVADLVGTCCRRRGTTTFWSNRVQCIEQRLSSDAVPQKVRRYSREKEVQLRSRRGHTNTIVVFWVAFLSFGVLLIALYIHPAAHQQLKPFFGL